jgi:hypothetical protein
MAFKLDCFFQREKMDLVEKVMATPGLEYLSMVVERGRSRALSALGVSPAVRDVLAYLHDNPSLVVPDEVLGRLVPVREEKIWALELREQVSYSQAHNWWTTFRAPYHWEHVVATFGDPVFRRDVRVEEGKCGFTNAPVSEAQRVPVEIVEVAEMFSVELDERDEQTVQCDHSWESLRGQWCVKDVKLAHDVVHWFGLDALVRGHRDAVVLSGRTAAVTGSFFDPDEAGYCYLKAFEPGATTRIGLALGPYPTLAEVSAVYYAATVYSFAAAWPVCLTSSSFGERRDVLHVEWASRADPRFGTMFELASGLSACWHRKRLGLVTLDDVDGPVGGATGVWVAASGVASRWGLESHRLVYSVMTSFRARGVAREYHTSSELTQSCVVVVPNRVDLPAAVKEFPGHRVVDVEGWPGQWEDVCVFAESKDGVAYPEWMLLALTSGRRTLGVMDRRGSGGFFNQVLDLEKSVVTAFQDSESRFPSFTVTPGFPLVGDDRVFQRLVEVLEMEPLVAYDLLARFAARSGAIADAYRISDLPDGVALVCASDGESSSLRERVRGFPVRSVSEVISHPEVMVCLCGSFEYTSPDAIVLALEEARRVWIDVASVPDTSWIWELQAFLDQHGPRLVEHWWARFGCRGV